VGHPRSVEAWGKIKGKTAIRTLEAEGAPPSSNS
jgi:hypothetical protein